MSNRPVIVVAAAIGSLAAAIAVVKLLECPVVRRRLGLPENPKSEGTSECPALPTKYQSE